MRVAKIALGLLTCLILSGEGRAGETGHVSAVDNAKRGADAGIRMEGYRGTASAVGEYGVGSAVGGLFIGQVLGNSFCSIEAYGARMQGFISSGNGGELCPLLLGGDAHARHTGTGDVPYLSGMRVKVELGGAGSTTDEMGGVDVEAANAGGTAALAYGLRLPDMTSMGTDSWAIMSLGGDSFHVGRLTLGSTDPPATDAILDLDTTDAAFLPPRLTDAQRDALTPTEGMQVYNLTAGRMEQYDGAAWVSMGGGSVELDLGNDTSLESSAITRISTNADANSLVTEPSANQILFDFSKAVPKADDANTLDSLDSLAFGLVANPLSQFAATTSAQLAGVLSDETGFSTGALSVFNINPTLDGITLTDVLTAGAGLDMDFNVPTGKLFIWNINSAPMLVMGSNYLGPNGANMALGRAAVGWTGLYLDETGVGSDTVHLVAPAALSAPIQVVLPSSAGTLALTSDIPAAFTTEDAQDAVGAMVNTTLVYTDGTPLLQVNPDLSIDSITLADLTSGRVPYATTAGLLTDDADLRFDGTTLEIGTIDAQNAAASIRAASTGIAGTFERNNDVNSLVAVTDFFQSAAAGTGSNHTFSFKDSGGTRRLGVRAGARLTARAASTVSADYVISTVNVGTEVDRIVVTSTGMRPGAAGLELGTASVGWGGVYFDETGAGTDAGKLQAPSSLASGVTWTLPTEAATLVGTVAELNLEDQTAAVGSTALHTPPTAGYYRVSVVVTCNRAASVSSTLGANARIAFTPVDTAAGVVHYVPLAIAGSGVAVGAAGTTLNAVDTVLHGTMLIHTTAAAITYLNDYTSSGGTTMRYDVRVRLERLN
jgi:hypothetical protein